VRGGLVKRDLAARLLGGVVRLLPAGRGDWARAMRAELATVEAPRARWGFVAGCARAVVRQPEAPRRAAYPLLIAAIAVAVVDRVGTLAYLPLRFTVVGLFGVLIAVSWWGRRPGPLGPVRPVRSARLARVAGYLLVVGLGGSILPLLWKDPHREADATGIGVAFTVVLATVLAGFLALTADRSAATARVWATGFGWAVTVAAVWAVSVIAVGVLPADIAGASFAVAAGMVAAAVSNAGRGGRWRSLLAALSAGVVGSVLVFQLLSLLARYGPDRLIPDLVGRAALTPADALEQSRAEVVDPFVGLAFGGFLIAGLLLAVAVWTRPRSAPAIEPEESTVDYVRP
jgi:hypothetical protein